ncbi:MAG: hypothetical protein QM770_07240 [Tepidisphaeraceae bacterium]
MSQPSTIHHRRSTLRVLACALVALAGCGAPKPATTQTAQDPPVVPSPISNIDLPTAQQLADQARDAVSTRKRIYSLTIYSLTVPAGSISANADFWKRIDEDAIDPVMHQTQQWNGIRVGVAPQTEFDHLRKYVDDPEAKESRVAGNRAENINFELARNIREERLLWYDRNGTMRMRSFDQSSNLLYFKFRQPLRQPDKIELSIVPAVKGERYQLRTTKRGEQSEVDFTQPEYIYDLGLTLDLPLDRFVVISPSPTARDLSNAGRLFFTKDEPGQQMERVIVILPSVTGEVQEVPLAQQAR